MKKYTIISRSQINLTHANIKDIVVFSKTGSNSYKSTEDVFEMEIEPENTCPFIDKAQEIIAENVRKINNFIEKEIDWALNSSIPECEYCKNEEIRRSNLNKIRDYKLEIEEQVSILEDASYYLEKLRDDCVNTRNHGAEVKKVLWSFLEENELNEEKIEETFSLLGDLEDFPSPEFKQRDYEDFFDKKINFSIKDFEETEACESEDCPFRYNDEQRTFSYLEFDSGLLNIVDYDDAYENFEKIVNWASLWLEKTENILRDQNLIDEIKKIINYDRFVQHYIKMSNNIYYISWKEIEIEKEQLILNDIEQMLPFFQKDYDFEYSLIKKLLAETRNIFEQIIAIDIKVEYDKHKEETHKAYNRLNPQLEAIYDILYDRNRKINKEYLEKLKEIYYKFYRHTLFSKSRTYQYPEKMVVLE